MALQWLKKGADSAAIAKKEEAEAQKRKDETGKMWRFYLKEKEEASITFVDGGLSPEGFLLPPRFYEHNMYLNGSWNNLFVCPEKTNPESGEKCPLCESGDRPSMVALFTVIDHRTFQSKSDSTKSFTNSPKLLAAKSITFELLNKIALKRGGLAGATFDVSRIGDKAASVGSMFDFTEKRDAEVLKKLFTKTVKDEKGQEKTVSVYEAANYENEIEYRTGDQLRELGFGNQGVSQSTMKKSLPNPQAASAVDYESQL
jgi:hypothetical protein